MQGFVLGLSSGAVCAAYCAPVLVPYLLGEGRGVLRNFSALMQFLMGRLLGYLAFAFLAWGLNQSLLQNAAQRSLLIGSAYVVLSVSLIFYSLFRAGHVCPGAGDRGVARRLRRDLADACPFRRGACHRVEFLPALSPRRYHRGGADESCAERPVLPDLLSGNVPVSHPGALSGAAPGCFRSADRR